LSRTYRNRSAKQRRASRTEEFRCQQCGLFVGPTISGGKYRNHCPYCLYSRHVDGDHPGDRASDCAGLMEPVGVFTRPKGEHVLVHRCLTCGFERHNRIAADDDFEAVLALPSVAPRRLAGRRSEASFEESA
jgi:hypothetical protein